MTKSSFGSKKGPAINDRISAKSVRVISEKGEMLGVLEINRALQMAFEEGLDLVEVSPNASPPVCKIIDYGKYRYQIQKKQAEAKKKQKTFEVKEVKLRPGIEDHDYGVKLKSIQRFLSEGDKVKITLRFKGREMAYQQRGMDILKKLESEIEPLAKIEQAPALEGKHMIMVVAPR
ncbi:MAG: translation initiation factor IF-3 [Rickettsiales bacterium]|nr:translation initiation factor IF-3 [Rickettsiales bacterium]|tara:strand:- start:295 stop:822 length:528 start_codon:yes stop_codon:yes gene_type:complete